MIVGRGFTVSSELTRPIPDEGSDPPSIRQLLQQYQGDIFYDVGANTGQTARRLSDNFTYINSFEPCFESYSILRDSKPANCESFNIAISDHDGMVTLTETESAIRSGQLTTGIGLNWGKKVGTRTVPCLTIDSIAENLGHPRLIKVDVEGHEKEVIEGAFYTLKKTPQPRLLIEIHYEPNAKAICTMLRSAYAFTCHEHEYLTNSPMGQHHFYLQCEPKVTR